MTIREMTTCVMADTAARLDTPTWLLFLSNTGMPFRSSLNDNSMNIDYVVSSI